jgi:uncharacterized protein YodC (DUF2158 family)
MRTEVPNASYVSEMFIAYVRRNKVAPAQVEDVLRAIKRGFGPFLVDHCIANDSLRGPASHGAIPGKYSGSPQDAKQHFKPLIHDIVADKHPSKAKHLASLHVDSANDFIPDAPSITAVDLNTHAREERLVTFEEPQPGDEVVLRTGGPVMTVLGSDDDRPRELCCAWFDEQRHRCQGTFHLDLLVIVEPVV